MSVVVITIISYTIVVVLVVVYAHPAERRTAYIITGTNCRDELLRKYPWHESLSLAAANRGMDLCLCGYFGDLLLEKAPHLEPQSSCDCTERNSDAFYHLYFPCESLEEDAVELAQRERCVGLRMENGDDSPVNIMRMVGDPSDKQYQNFSETRLFFIHATVMVDRLSRKDKLSDSLKNVYGPDKAAMVLPRTFLLWHQEDRDSLYRLVENVVRESSTSGQDSSTMADNYFIVKNPDHHLQQGLAITTSKSLYLNGGMPHGEGFNVVTKFIPNPFLVNGLKVNVRRFLLAVCTEGGRLRAYVHDDGRNFFTEQPYAEPGTMMQSDNLEYVDHEEVFSRIITTVPGAMDGDYPLTGNMFFDYLNERGYNTTLFQQSMHARLALAVHASRTDGDFDLCETEDNKLDAPGIPPCLKGSIRYQHFGGDFHVDAELTGYQSRLFELNKGPGMSAFHPVKCKIIYPMYREVQTDMLSFMGFEGAFDGAPETARRYNLTLIYDSESFDADEYFRFLESLRYRSSRSRSGGDNNDDSRDNEEL